MFTSNYFVVFFLLIVSKSVGNVGSIGLKDHMTKKNVVTKNPENPVWNHYDAQLPRDWRVEAPWRPD